MGKLKREIGLIGLTFVAVSGIIGSGWLFAPLLAAQHAGPAALIAWVIGGAAMLLFALTFAEISAMLPVAGGIARVPQFSHGNVVAMAMGWSAWVGYNTTAPIEVEAMLRYLGPHLGWLYTAPGSGSLSWAGVAAAGLMMVCFTVINAFGVRFFTRVNTAITWLKIAIPLVVIVALLAARFEPANFTQVGGGFAPFGVAGVLAAVSSGGIAFSFIGFRHAIDMAGEVKNPGVTIPIALVLALAIAFVVYGGIQFAFTGALLPSDLAHGWGALALPGDFGPLGALAAALGMLWLVSLLNFGAVVGPFAGGLVSVGSNARLAFALAENGFFPERFAALSARGVPVAALLLNLVFSLTTFVLLPFSEVVQLNSSAVILSFVVGPVAVVALRQLLPDATRPLRVPAVKLVAPVAFIIATFIIYWSGWPTVWRLGLCLLAGLVLFLFHARHRAAGSLDLAEAVWLAPYLGGLGLVSFLGSFGGVGLIPFGWDLLVLAALGGGAFALAVGERLSQAKFDRYMSEERVLDAATEEGPEVRV
jgi:amino acid transporter